ncbi:MAG: DUF362 domain-containing protein [Acidobacteria bacterium]|nr:DUF362 domain-containing protein [Acidobacteriota bacterium]
MSPPIDEWRLTRRHFLGALALPLVASACARTPPYDPARFQLPAQSDVMLLPADSYDIDFSDVIGRALDDLAFDVRGRRVFLKPNMVEYEPGTIINTDPRVLVGAAIAFQRAGAAEVIVGEGPGHRRDSEYLLTSTGLYDHLRENRLRFVDLNHDDVAEVALGSRFTGLTDLALPVELQRADVIVSMPKLKTHHWAGLTGAMKNLFGTVPGAVYGWPKNLLHFKGVDNSIIDLTATIRPHLAIVDGVTAMEGDGPIMGTPRHLGLLAIGRDLVAVDATCARIIGLDPGRMPYLAQAGKFLGNVGAGRIVQRGEPTSRYETSFHVVDRMKHLRLRG